MDKAWVHCIKKKGIRNYAFLLKKKAGKKQVIPLYQFLDRFINQALYKVPDNLDLHNVFLSWKTDSTYYSLQLPQAGIENHRLHSTLIWSEAVQPWHITGLVYPSEKKIELKLYSEKNPLNFPILKTKFNLNLGADTLQAALNGEDLHHEGIRIQLSAGVHKLNIRQPRLSDNYVQFPYLKFNGTIQLDQGQFSIDSNSTLTINQIKVHPYIAYSFSPEKKYSLKFNSEMAPAQSFFNALPQGLFETMQGIQVRVDCLTILTSI